MVDRWAADGFEFGLTPIGPNEPQAHGMTGNLKSFKAAIVHGLSRVWIPTMPNQPLFRCPKVAVTPFLFGEYPGWELALIGNELRIRQWCLNNH